MRTHVHKNQMLIKSNACCMQLDFYNTHECVLLLLLLLKHHFQQDFYLHAIRVNMGRGMYVNFFDYFYQTATENKAVRTLSDHNMYNNPAKTWELKYKITFSLTYQSRQGVVDFKQPFMVAAMPRFILQLNNKLKGCELNASNGRNQKDGNVD